MPDDEELTVGTCVDVALPVGLSVCAWLDDSVRLEVPVLEGVAAPESDVLAVGEREAVCEYEPPGERA